MTTGRKLVLYGLLTATSILFMFPIYWMLIGSLKTRECTAMTPPAYYPCEVRTVSFTLSGMGRLMTIDGQEWFKLCSSEDLFGVHEGAGGYYLKLDKRRPSALVRWFAEDVGEAVVWDAGLDRVIISFDEVPIHYLDEAEAYAAIVAKMIRQEAGHYHEILFCAEPDGAGETAVVPRLNVGHHEVRDFHARWQNYADTLRGPDATFSEERIGFGVYLRNSFFVALMAVLGQLASSSLVAYGFSRLRFKGRQFWFILLLATMMIPGQVTLIPLFAVYKWLGWIDTFWPLIVPHFTAGAFNVFLLRQYMLTLPRELDESATIDGCGPLRRYLYIVLPNCWPVLTVVALFTFVYAWQDVMGPLIYLDNPAYRTVPLGLEYFRSPYVDNRHLLMTGACLAMAPVVLAFIFLQRHIMSGIATTGLKG